MAAALPSPSAVVRLAAAVLLSLSSWRARGVVSKDVVTHISCQVCEHAVEAADRYVKNEKIGRTEDELVDMLDGICSVSKTKKQGRWVAQLDITRKNKDAQLEVEVRDEVGFCRNECTAIQRACTSSLKGNEDKLVELLMQEKSVKEMRKKVCKKACDKKRKIPKMEGWKDEEFSPRDSKEVETEDMVEKMRQETGMGMKMYKREDLMSMSEGDMETMSAREAFAQERNEERMAEKA